MEQKTMSVKIDRRGFLLAAGTLAAASAGALGLPLWAKAASAIKLPPLPFKENALEPYISARTLGFHYGKHHAGYVKKTNKFIKGTKYQNMPLVKIIQSSAGKPAEKNIFNNAAQVFNHDFYWQSLKPGGGGKPSGRLLERVLADFGGLDKFREAFGRAAAGQFGSGWAWLVEKNGRLAVIKTANADTPIAHGIKPLITLDVWEHAYYLDYQNRRSDYIAAFLDNLANWDFAARNLG